MRRARFDGIRTRSRVALVWAFRRMGFVPIRQLVDAAGRYQSAMVEKDKALDVERERIDAIVGRFMRVNGDGYLGRGRRLVVRVEILDSILALGVPGSGDDVRYIVRRVAQQFERELTTANLVRLQVEALEADARLRGGVTP